MVIFNRSLSASTVGTSRECAGGRVTSAAGAGEGKLGSECTNRAGAQTSCLTAAPWASLRVQ